MNYLYNNPQIFIWGFMYIFFSVLMYFYGIKGDWQKLRIKRGLVDNKGRNAPKFYQKYQINSRSHFINCLKLQGMTFFISLIIIMVFYSTTSTKNISNILNFINVFISLLFIYLIISGAPIESKNNFENDKEKIFVKVISAVSFIKSKIIESVVNDEYEYYENEIMKNIIEAYKNNDRTSLGTLIIRINSDFFNGILPDDAKDSDKEQLKDYDLKLLKLYREKDSSLLDELERLFRDKIFRNNAKMADIIRFISNLELVASKTSQVDIDNYIDRQFNVQTSIKKTKTRKMKSLSQLDQIINDNINIESAVSKVEHCK